MKTLASKYTVIFCSAAALLYAACAKDCEDCNSPGQVDQQTPKVFLAYLNSLSQTLFVVQGHEAEFFQAFQVKEGGGTEFFLPPTSTLPDGMPFKIKYLSETELNKVAAGEDAAFMQFLAAEQPAAFFAGVTINDQVCGEVVEVGEELEGCTSYTQHGQTFSRRSVSTSNYTRCKSKYESTCSATMKEVGKTQHYTGAGCDKSQGAGSVPYYAWVCP